jgi:hypothetical protein
MLLLFILLFSCVYNFCINTLQSYQRSPNMSSVRERQRLLMQRNYKDATYLEQQNYRRRLQYQRLQQVQHELTGMFFDNFFLLTNFIFSFVAPLSMLSSLSPNSSEPPSVPHSNNPACSSPVNVVQWWVLLREHPPTPITPATWNRSCPHCHTLLLSTESNSFCCGDGTRVLPPLPPLPTRMQILINDSTRRLHLMEFCRVINNFFSFAGIGVSGGFEHFQSGAGAHQEKPLGYIVSYRRMPKYR